MAKHLITLGTILIFCGILWPTLSKLPLGRLPGDIAIARGQVKFYAPITTSILLSIIISMLLWIFRRS